MDLSLGTCFPRHVGVCSVTVVRTPDLYDLDPPDIKTFRISIRKLPVYLEMHHRSSASSRFSLRRSFNDVSPYGLHKHSLQVGLYLESTYSEPCVASPSEQLYTTPGSVRQIARGRAQHHHNDSFQACTIRARTLSDSASTSHQQILDIASSDSSGFDS